ncbi:hypothetical protein NQ314_004062, partial [Rhamnusium bicolor]
GFKRTHSESNFRQDKQNKRNDKSEQRCYNCKGKGHFSNKCPKPRLECTNCKRLGHVAKDCKESNSRAGHYRLHNKVIGGYGGSIVNVIGETDVFLKVDRAEGSVKALIVPNSAQEIPVMIGQTFLNRPEVLTIVFGETVRLLSAEDDLNAVLNLPSKIPLWVKENTVIRPKTIALVVVTSRGLTERDVYIHGGLRSARENEYYVDECITKGEDGCVTITNLSQQEIEVSTNQILARCVSCLEDISLNSYTFAFSTTIQNRSFTANDLSYNENLTSDEINKLIDLIN